MRSSLVFVSFPTHVSCIDAYCPDNEYGQHSHTAYNVYGVESRFYREGMNEIDASEIATEIRPNEIMPAAVVKGAFQNV